MEKTICELFAGVGGFRLGFERLNKDWKTVWFNQWEPSTKHQAAHDCYVAHFGDIVDSKGNTTTCKDIALVDKKDIPNHTLLAAGFPCQDYSVARSLSNERGIEGKKGILWWEIYKTIVAKKPYFCLFENVDRLLKAPSKQRGRDFGIMLASLNSLGYDVEWRVVNAAMYGAVQKRVRVFIFAYRRDTRYAEEIRKIEIEDILSKSGFFAKTFQVELVKNMIECTISEDIVAISNTFSFNFKKSGYMRGNKVYTIDIKEKEEDFKVLRDIVQIGADNKYYLTEKEKEKMGYLKGAKKISRTSSTGYKYTYSEGAMAYPDSLDKQGRTMLTSEGTINRCSHVIRDIETNNLRRITPLEAERLQGFEDNWTNTGMSERMRYFCMGNALVVPMVEKMGKTLTEIVEAEA